MILTETEVLLLPIGSEIEAVRMSADSVLAANHKYALRKISKHAWAIKDIQAQYETNPTSKDWENPTLVSTPTK